MFSKWKYVYEVYKEQSFTSAAKKLFISQPSLSAAVKNVENKIGTQLFERTGRGIEITEVGKEYILAAEQILSIENEFKKKFGDICNLESGTLIVGGGNYVSSYILPKIITRFRALYPKLCIELKEANSHTLNKMLLNDEVDIIIDSLDDACELVKYPLCNEEIFICVSKDNKINKGLEKYCIQPENIRCSSAELDSVEPVSIETFRNEQFVLLKEENDMYMRASKIFQKRNIEPDVVFSVDQLSTSYSLADSNVGLCFITDTFFRYAQHHDNVVLYKIKEETEGRKMYVAHKKNKYCSKAMSEFICITDAAFKEKLI